MPLVWYVDGQRVAKGQTTLDLAEGEYLIRFKNDRYWVDERRSVKLVAGEAADVAWRFPSLTTLVVQAFPANCTVSLRKPGGRWKEVDETPASLRLATGEYEVRVTLRATGASKEQRVTLRPGENPPLRVSFGAGS
jgi:ferric-dicitrate binding protein FerR (iron transport regulator)